MVKAQSNLAIWSRLLLNTQMNTIFGAPKFLTDLRLMYTRRSFPVRNTFSTSILVSHDNPQAHPPRLVETVAINRAKRMFGLGRKQCLFLKIMTVYLIH